MTQSPAERRLSFLQARLDTLGARLLEREVRLYELRQEISDFETEYQERVGPYLARLDELTADLYEWRAAAEPSNGELRAAAVRARERIERAEVEATESVSALARAEFAGGIRKQFRKAAMRLHPDRAVDEADRLRREHWMARLNVAYSRGDASAIGVVIADFEQSPEAFPDECVEARLERTRQHSSAVHRKIFRIEREIAELEAGASNCLRLEFASQSGEGLDPFIQLIADIQQHIAGVEAEMRHLQGKSRRQRQRLGREAQRFSTERGEKVRSKSVAAIANVLHRIGVRYRYGQCLAAEDECPLRPDFMVFDADARPLLWEHLGSAQEVHGPVWEDKLAVYQAKGFIPGLNLFITRDEADGSLDASKIVRVAKFIQALTETA